MNYRINSQNDTIEKILLAFEELTIGIGIASICDIKVNRGEYSSTIVMTPKEGKEISQSDFFWLGYFVGRDFEECRACTERTERAKQHIDSITNKSAKFKSE